MKHCVITGAADGIGKALAQCFAAEGYSITGIDYDTTRSDQTGDKLAQHGSAVTFMYADLASRTHIEQILEQLQMGPPIDVFIHNAGINAVGHFATLDLQCQRTVVDVNLLAPMLLTAGILNKGKMQTGGSIVFISSLSHFVGYPGAAAYAASKDGLSAYARSLVIALARHDIHVLTVYPGPTRTAHARRYSPDNQSERNRMDPAQLAPLIRQAVGQRRSILIPGMRTKMFAVLGHYMPSLTEWFLRKTILERLEQTLPRRV